MTTSSTSSAPTTLRFRVLGDSLAAGVGSARPQDTLGHLLRDHLRAAGYRVDLGVHAVSGARSADLVSQVRAAISTGVDLALVVIGANDLTGFVPPHIGASLLHDAVTDLRRAGGQVVVVTAPDLSVVSRVPPAYRPFVSAVSENYARAQNEAVVRAGGVVAPVDPQVIARFATDAALFSSDRYHPSSLGYRVVADILAPCVTAAAAAAAR